MFTYIKLERTNSWNIKVFLIQIFVNKNKIQNDNVKEFAVINTLHFVSEWKSDSKFFLIQYAFKNICQTMKQFSNLKIA